MLRICLRLLPLCLASWPLFAEQINGDAVFITMGPGPSLNPQEGDHNSDAGSVSPIAVHPTDPNIYQLSAVNGGLWRTLNAGKTWEPTNDGGRSLLFTSISYDPDDTTHNTLCAGSGIANNETLAGDGFFDSTQNPGTYPLGLVISNNGGTTWSRKTGIIDGMSIPNILSRNLASPDSNVGTIFVPTFEPTAPYALVRPAIPFEQLPAANYGFYISTDGGATYTLEPTGGPQQLGPGPVSSLARKPSDPNTMYAAVTNTGTPAANAAAALYKNTDGTGTTWTPVFDKNTVPSGGANPIDGTDQWVIKTVTGPNDSVAMVLIKAPTGGNASTYMLESVFLSQDGGTNWVALPLPPPGPGSINPITPEGNGVVNSNIVIDPADSNIVYVAGTFDPSFNGNALSAYILQPSTPAKSFALPSDGTICHSGSRFLAFDAAGRLLVGSDGGVAVRTDPKSNSGSWSSINGSLSLWQSYGTAFDANKHLIMSAGQNTGVTVQTVSYQPGAYTTVPNTGNGVNAAINDVGDTSYYYHSSANLANLARMTNGDQTTNQLLTLTFNGNPFQFDDTNAWFSSKLVLNRIDPTKLAFGGLNNVYIGQDSLDAAPIALTAVGPTSPAIANAGPMAYGTQDSPNALLVGTSGTTPSTPNVLFFTPDASTTALSPLPNFVPTANHVPVSVVFDGRTQNRFYVADGENLFGTNDRGATFTNLSSNINAFGIAALCGVEFLSNNGVNALFVGGVNVQNGLNGPFGVASSNDAGVLSDWFVFGIINQDHNLSNTFATLINYNNKSDTLLVGLYGRGNWLMYDVTSNFSSAQELWFGKADNDSDPILDVLNNGDYTHRPLKKFGTGTLTIEGPATYTGLTSVLGGTLSLSKSESSIPGDVDVKSGTLKGIGKVGGKVAVESGSTISPGNGAIGTLTVGSLALESGAQTQIVINPVDSSKISVSGNAAVAGQILIEQLPGEYSAHAWDIVVANGSVSGAFDPTILGGLPGFKFGLRYFPNHIQLVLLTDIKTTGLTGNNLAYANYLNTYAPSSEAKLLLSALSGEALENALEKSAPTRNAISRFVIDNVMFTYSDLLDHHLALAHRNHIDCVPTTCECGDFWLDGFGVFGQLDGQDQTPGFSFDSDGLFVGYDKYLDQNTLVGLTAGYSHSRYHENNRFGKGNIYSYVVSPYTIIYRGDAFIEGAITWSYNAIKNKRYIGFQGYYSIAHSRHHSNQLMPHLAIGYDWQGCYGVLEPFAEFDWVFNREQAYREHGSNVFDFQQKRSDSSVLRSKLGFNVYYTSDWGIMLKGCAAYVNKAFFDVGKVQAALVGNPKYFTLKTFKQNQNLFTLGVTGLFEGSDGWYGSVAYDGEFGNKYIANDLQLQFGRAF